MIIQSFFLNKISILTPDIFNTYMHLLKRCDHVKAGVATNLCIFSGRYSNHILSAISAGSPMLTG